MVMKKSKPVVIDTSVIVKWLNQKDELYLSQADKIFQDDRKSGEGRSGEGRMGCKKRSQEDKRGL